VSVGFLKRRSKLVRSIKIIFGVAVINLMVLAFELAMNVIRTVTG